MEGEANRCKILSISQAQVLDFFRAVLAREGHLTVPVFPEIPTDVHVVAVHSSFASRSFDFLLEHPSFPEVEEGNEVPKLGPQSIWQREFEILSLEDHCARSQASDRPQGEGETYQLSPTQDVL